MKRILLFAFAIAILALPALACGAATGTNTGTAATDAPAGSTPTAKTFKVGDSVKIGTWTVKINKVSTSTGGDFAKPKSGNIFLIVNVTATNNDSKAQNISSALNFKLSDSTGQSYTETFTDNQKNAPDGAVSAGAKVSGDLAYEVPKSEHSFSMVFQPDIISNDQATWDLTAK